MKYLKILFIALFSILSMGLSAQDIEDAIEESVNIDSLISEAQNGNEQAILELSIAYYTGENLEEDGDKAFELAASIADKNEKAKLLIANYLYYGVGTAPDEEGAKIMLRQLSKKGDEKAAEFLKKIEEDEVYPLYSLEYGFLPNLYGLSSFFPDLLTDTDSWKELLSSFGKDKYEFSWKDISAEEIKMGKNEHLYVYTLPASNDIPSTIYSAIYIDDIKNGSLYFTLEKKYNQVGLEHVVFCAYGTEMDLINEKEYNRPYTKQIFIKEIKKAEKPITPVEDE